MPFPVAHLLSGAAVVATLGVGGGTGRARRAEVTCGALLALAPDADFFLTLVLGLEKSWHRGFTHSLLAAAAAAAAAALLVGPWSWRRWAALTAAAASHGALDFFASVKAGVDLFWPLPVGRVAAGLFEYPDVLDLRYFWQNDMLVVSGLRQILAVSLYEFLVFGPPLALALAARAAGSRRRGMGGKAEPGRSAGSVHPP